MRIGVPKEVKNHEYRVAITPIGVHELTAHGHQVSIQQGAGIGSGISDDEYVAAGATIIDEADDVWAEAETVLKVKEPVAEEYHRMREGQLLFTYLHLAADRPLTEELIKRQVTAIAYETVQLPDGSLPLLAPMSEVARSSPSPTRRSSARRSSSPAWSSIGAGAGKRSRCARGMASTSTSRRRVRRSGGVGRGASATTSAP